MALSIGDKPSRLASRATNDQSSGSAGESASILAPATRYYFNLTDGDNVILDKEGVVAASIQVAVIAAMEAVAELLSEAPEDAAEWQGWRLEIVNAAGQAVQSMPLDATSAH